MSSVNKGKLYKDFLSAYTKTYLDTKSKQLIQDNVNSIWNNVKRNTDVKSLIEAEISKLNKIRAKKQLGIQQFWIGLSDRSNASAEPSSSDHKENSATLTTANFSSVESNTSVNDVSNEKSVPPAQEASTEKYAPLTESATKKFATPAQAKIRNEIVVLDADIVALKQRKNCGLINDEMNRELNLKTKKLETLRKLIKKHEREMVRHRERRLQNKINIEKACVTHPDLKNKLNVRGTVGRQTINRFF